MRPTRTWSVAILLGLLMFPVACDPEKFMKTGEWRFLDPSKPVSRDHAGRRAKSILSSVSELDKEGDLFPNASRPGPEDWVYADEDYRIHGSGLNGPGRNLVLAMQTTF